MAKDINSGFKVGDRIKHKKSGFIGSITDFEWTGMNRSALVPSGKSNKSLYIYGLNEIELMPIEIDIPNEEEMEDGKRNN